MLEVRRLALLAAVVDTGSDYRCRGAAGLHPVRGCKELRRGLKVEAGQPLLHRQARGVRPTEAELCWQATLVTSCVASAPPRPTSPSSPDLRRGTVAVGVFPTVASALLPQVVSRFRRQYPDLRLDVRSTRFDELVELLENGTVGIALLWDYAWNRVDVADISLTPLLDDPTVLVVAADHRLARKRFTTMSELADEDWIVRAHDHPVAEVLERSCRAAGFTPKIAFEANDYQEAQAMVSVGLGVALAPRTAVRNPNPDVRVLALGTDVPARRVLLAHRQDRLRAPGELAMHQLLVDVAREYQTKA